MDFSSIDPFSFAALTFAIVGIIELAKRLFNKDYQAAAIIAAAGVAGALLAQFVKIDWFMGLLIGLNASGLITTASYVAPQLNIKK